MLVQLQKNWPADPPIPGPSPESLSDLLSMENLVAILRRRAKLVAAVVAAMLVVGVVYLATTRPMFGSTALVYLDIENAQTLDGSRPNVNGVLARPDDVDVNSQLQIIKSEKIALRVIGQFGLADAEEFTRPQNAIAGFAAAAMRAIRSAIGSIVRFGQSPEALPEEAGVPRAIVEGFAKRLYVARLDETFVIAIGFTSEDRQLASDVANAVANAYLEEKLDARYEAVRHASSWLEERLTGLRAKAVQSDQLVQDYKRENDIIDTNTAAGSSQLLSDTQLTEQSARLVEAQKVTAERRARYNQIAQMMASGNPDAAVVDSLSSPVVNQLRQQYSRLAQQEADVSRRYGAEHEAARKARQQMEDINGLIMGELGRIEQVYKGDLDVASKQEADLARSLEGYTTRSSDIAQALVRLRELERNAEADQNLYQSFLDRYKSALQQQSFPITDARVLTAASPARGKSSPKTVMTLALAGIAGVGLGLLLALGREMADRTFRTPRQIERSLGVPCLGILPRLPRAQARRPFSKSAPGDRVLARDLGVFQHVVKAPLSRFAETLRAARLAIDVAPNEGGVRVIGVVSSMPGEGKSTVAMNIAQLIAASGSSVLVIDADLRSPTLSREITPNAEAGLLEFLVNNASVNDLIYSDETKKLKFLPAAGKGGGAQKTDLIGSGKMAQLLTAARQSYNYVVIDLPPLAPVIDAKAIAGSVDGFVFVVEWGATPIATVTDALHDSSLVNRKIIGCLLNKADEGNLHLYTSSAGNSTYYHHEKFGSYVSQS